MHIFLYLLAFFLLCIAGFINYNHRGSLNLRIAVSAVLLICAASLCAYTFFAKRIKIDLSGFISKKEAFAWFISSAVLLTVVAGLLLPTNLIVSSPQEFSYIDQYSSPLFFIGNTLTQVIGFCLFWPICLYFLFSDKIKRVFACIFVCAAVSALVNAFIFPGSYGFISTAFIFAQDVKHTIVQSAVNISVSALAVAAAFILLKFRKSKIVTTLAALASVSICTLSFINSSGKFQNTVS